MASVTLEERVARDAEIKARLAEIDAEHAGDALPEEVRSEWNDLNLEREELSKIITELRERAARLEELKDKEEARDEPKRFYTSSRKSDTEVHDVFEIRNMSKSAEHEVELMRDNAFRAVERATYEIPDGLGKNKGDMEAHLERLIDGDGTGEISRRVLTTGSPAYKRAFSKVMSGRQLTSEEARAMSTTTTAGGYAVPFALDPTMIPISNRAMNPIRHISRNVTITGANTWEGVSVTGITATYQVEAGTASDNTPTFAQPKGTVQKAQAFVPYTFEIEGDLPSFASELTRNFADAKDDLEATQFVTGTGTAPAPVGIIGTQGLGTASLLATAGTAALVIGDIDKTQATLAPRWRSRAVWVANLGFYNRVRRMYTAGGETLMPAGGPGNAAGFQSVLDSDGTIGYGLLGRPAYESTAINTTNVLTSSTTQAVFGDFSRGFVVVDRVGMNVEVVNHMFGASGYPNGTRGLLAWWRNCTVLVTSNAFVYLQTL